MGTCWCKGRGTVKDPTISNPPLHTSQLRDKKGRGEREKGKRPAVDRKKHILPMVFGHHSVPWSRRATRAGGNSSYKLPGAP